MMNPSTVVERNKSIIKILVITLLLLFTAVSMRVISMYRKYNEFEESKKVTEENILTNKKEVIKSIIEMGNEISKEDVNLETVELHNLLLSTFTQEELYDIVAERNINPDIIEKFDEVFDLENENANSVVTIGVKDFVLYNSSNTDLKKFDYIDTNGKIIIPWDEFFENMDDPKVTKKGFEDLALKKQKIIILRLDGQYKNGSYCTVDDVIDDYMINGMKNMDKYMILNVGLITDDGDILGGKDVNYIDKQISESKIHIFKSVSVDKYLKEYSSLIKSFDENIEDNMKDIERKTVQEFTTSIFVTILLIIILIIIMYVIKHIDDENDKIIENQEKENKEIK